jgi:hypothetical protein
MAKKQTSYRTSFPLAATEGFGDDKGNGYDYSTRKKGESGETIYSAPVNPKMPAVGSAEYTKKSAKSGLSWSQTAPTYSYASELKVVKDPKTGKSKPMPAHTTEDVQAFAKKQGYNLAYESATRIRRAGNRAAYKAERERRKAKKGLSGK